MTNIETYHEIMKLTTQIFKLSDSMMPKLKCKRICDLCNRGIANERLREDTADNKHVPSGDMDNNAYGDSIDKNTVV